MCALIRRVCISCNMHTGQYHVHVEQKFCSMHEWDMHAWGFVSFAGIYIYIYIYIYMYIMYACMHACMYVHIYNIIQKPIVGFKGLPRSYVCVCVCVCVTTSYCVSSWVMFGCLDMNNFSFFQPSRSLCLPHTCTYTHMLHTHTCTYTHMYIHTSKGHMHVPANNTTQLSTYIHTYIYIHTIL